jgi:prepilin-type N-terminal cleavage/methylation domain-containing protein/prepilin-type processing-associated H-X9-DG protein
MRMSGHLGAGRSGTRALGFSLIELMLVIGIIGILLGLSLPLLARARDRAVKATCGASLKQIGLAIESYRMEFKGQMPKARYMPSPFLSGDNDPTLASRLNNYLDNGGGETSKVFKCPGDRQVFVLAGSSYMYQSEVSGVILEQWFPVKYFNIPLSEVVVSRDFDLGTFDLEGDKTITVQAFHDVRNLLFADGHVGNFSAAAP